MGAAGDRSFVLAGQVRQLGITDPAGHDLLDRRGAVDDLVGGDPGHRRAEHHSRGVTAGLGGLQTDGLEFGPDGGHILNPDPVHLDVLPVVMSAVPRAYRVERLAEGFAIGAER